MNCFHEACQSNDINKVRHLLTILNKDQLNEQDINQRTGLHLAALNGQKQIVELLLNNCQIDRSIRNRWHQLAQDEANEDLKELFSTDDQQSIEWFDTYQNAYRIAFENHLQFKKWLQKISFNKLLENILNNYIDKNYFIENYFKQAIQNNDPIPLLKAYTEKTHFVTQINRDLAKYGSHFRFLFVFSQINNGYFDNEPPQDLSPFIYAAILCHHQQLQQYRQFTGITYRGMMLNQTDLDQYQLQKSILTKTFLSSSIQINIAQNFIQNDSIDQHKVICIYNIKDPSIAIDLQTISVYPNEYEILILPFSIFTIVNINKDNNGITFIQLDQFNLLESK